MTIVKKVKILGESWKIVITDNNKKYDLDNVSGYCDYSAKTCVICNKIDNQNFEGTNPRAYMKRVARHEITHAFMFESGLAYDSSEHQGAWAMNEEMIDWFARQITKIENVALEIDLVIDKMT